MNQQQYFASDEKHDMELNRLKMLEQLYDPITIRHLEAIQISKGWKCLEAGAGAGSVAQWLAKRVGSAGKVVATDTDTRFLSHLNISNLEIRQHNILKDDLENGQ